MNATPLLSAIIPTYNRRDLLRLTLEGLARQTVPADRFEALVISDGSTDGTNEMVREYAAKVPYSLRLLTQQNGGPSRARNQGIAAADGEILVLLDDDLEPEPDCLEAHLRIHREVERAAVIGQVCPDPARRRSEAPWVAWEHRMYAKNYGGLPADTWSEITAHHFISGNSSLRRELVLRVGGFNEEFRRQEDVELGFRLEQHCGVRFLYEPRAKGVHRPSRSLKSWLEIPLRYGSLDVQRARDGNIPWSRLEEGYYGRNPLTRILADLTLENPAATQVALSVLTGAARAAHFLGLTALSAVPLSAAYNLRYLEGVQQAMGTHGKVRQWLTPERLHAKASSS